jgi:hypothetical protein
MLARSLLRNGRQSSGAHAVANSRRGVQHDQRGGNLLACRWAVNTLKEKEQRALESDLTTGRRAITNRPRRTDKHERRTVQDRRVGTILYRQGRGMGERALGGADGRIRHGGGGTAFACGDGVVQCLVVGRAGAGWYGVWSYGRQARLRRAERRFAGAPPSQRAGTLSSSTEFCEHMSVRAGCRRGNAP